VIGRRDAMIAMALLPAFAGSAAAQANKPDDDLAEAKKLLSAFFSTSNQDNWAFVYEAFAEEVSGKTNDRHWMSWASNYKASEVRKLAKDGPRGMIHGKEEAYDFFRSRQYKAGWYWELPLRSESIWRPDYNTFAVYSRWDRSDGGYQSGPLSFNPRYLHLFGISKVEAAGSVVSRKISWFEEINVGHIVYG
jgi:hypothetical protein